MTANLVNFGGIAMPGKGGLQHENTIVFSRLTFPAETL